MSHNAWYEHFKEQLQGLTEAYEASGSSLPLLGYALAEKRLSSEEYLKWALAHYKLPRLQSRFFTETPLSQEMFAKWATHYRWSLECLPVAEWDGSLIVACLQPPQDFPSFPTPVLVLTSSEDLKQAWDYFHPEKVKAAAPKEDAPEGIDLSQATATSAAPKESFSFEDLGVPADASGEATNSGVELVEPAEEAAESAVDEALAGLLNTSTVVKLEALGDPLTTTKATIHAPESSTEKTVVLEKTAGENTFTGLTALGKIPPKPAVEGKPNVPPPPPPQAEQEMPFEDTFGNHPTPLVTKPGGVARPTVNPVAAGNFALEKLKKKNVALTERIKNTLSEMKVYFDKSMILTLDEQESQLVAFAWDENFQSIKDTNMRFPLKTPSIFNIVVTTQKSYHGYIALNEINERFFDDWNQGVVPDHVTITPMIMNDKIVGLLMGFADKTAYNKVSLNLAEKLSGEFVKGLQAA